MIKYITTQNIKITSKLSNNVLPLVNIPPPAKERSKP